MRKGTVLLSFSNTPVFLPRESCRQQSLVGCPFMGSHRIRHDWSDLACMHSPELSPNYFLSHFSSQLKHCFLVKSFLTILTKWTLLIHMFKIALYFYVIMFITVYSYKFESEFHLCLFIFLVQAQECREVMVNFHCIVCSTQDESDTQYTCNTDYFNGYMLWCGTSELLFGVRGNVHTASFMEF